MRSNDESEYFSFSGPKLDQISEQNIPRNFIKKGQKGESDFGDNEKNQSCSLSLTLMHQEHNSG